jgi:hypothetical protein
MGEVKRIRSLSTGELRPVVGLAIILHGILIKCFKKHFEVDR